MDHAKHTYIGYLTKTRGLKGELQLFFEYEEYEDLELDLLFLEIDRQLVPFFVEEYNLLNNRTAFLFLEDVDHIDKALPLLRKKVYFPTEKLPIRDPKEDFRWEDLKGYTVTDSREGLLGESSTVHEYPQQYVAVVPYKGCEILFPLNEHIIDELSMEEKQLQVTLPEGLIDLYLEN